MLDEFIHGIRTSEADIHSEITAIRQEAQNARAIYLNHLAGDEKTSLIEDIRKLETKRNWLVHGYFE